MQLEQSFELPAPPATAWPAFHDVDLLVQCLPGAALTGPAVDGELPLRFDVKLGPIAAGFIGSGRVTFDEAAQAGRFEGAAADRKTNSRVKGVADFKLAAEGTGTRVSMLVDYSLTGTLAQFSRGAIVRELASALTAQFAANLSQRLRVPPAAEAAAPHSAESQLSVLPSASVQTATAPSATPQSSSPSAVPRVDAAAPAVAPLDAGSLLASMLASTLKAAWQRLLGRFRRRSV